MARYDETLLLVLKTLNYVQHDSMANVREIVKTGEITIFVGRDFVVTVRHGEHASLAELRKRMDSTSASLLLGPFWGHARDR